MTIFDNYLLKKDKLVRRRIEIDNSLYEQLKELSEIYDTSINKLVNIAIVDMIKNNNIKLYERPDIEIVEAHNFAIREKSYKKLEELKAKSGITLFIISWRC